jgi:hypothetical protein
VSRANGGTLSMTDGRGTTGLDQATDERWFRDTRVLTCGTGRFARKTGSGEEEGRFTDFNALLAGAPIRTWRSGTVAHGPSRG